MTVLPLGLMSQLATVQALLGHSCQHEPSEFDANISRLNAADACGCDVSNDRYSPVSEGVLKRLVDDFPEELTNPLLLTLAPPHLRTLSLKMCLSVDENALTQLLKKCQKLSCLDISYCDDLVNSAMWLSYANISSLSLAKCATLHDSSVQKILTTLANLKHLNMCGCGQITDGAFHIVVACSRLVSVDLSSCHSLTKNVVLLLGALYSDCLLSLNISNTQMSYHVLLHLAGYLAGHTEDESDHTMTLDDPPAFLFRLQHLEICFLNDKHEKHDNHTQLARLYLKLFFASCAKSLEKFAITWSSGFDDEMLSYFAVKAQNIKSLCLTACCAVTNEGIYNLCRRCPYLQELNVDGISFLSELGELTELQKLSMSETDVTDSTLMRIVKNNGNTLRELSVPWCDELTAVGLDTVAAACPRLTAVNMRCTPASVATVTRLARRCPHLTALRLASVGGVTECSLVTIATHLRRLRELDVSWNDGVNNEGLQAVLSCCIQLTTLVLKGTRLISTDPFLPIISDWRQWQQRQTDLRQKLSEQDCGERKEDLPDVCLGCRSICYAPNLRFVDVEYCDFVREKLLAEIVAVCRGGLTVEDYYGQQVEPAWLSCRHGVVRRETLPQKLT